MAVYFSPEFNDQTFDANGDPAVGYKLFTYVAGSSTKQTTYTDSTGLVAQTNPIILNASGYPTNGSIWLTGNQTYKFVLALSTDTDPPTSPVKTIDGIKGVNDSSSSNTQWVSSGVTPTYVSATSFTLAGDQTTEFHIGRKLQFTVTAGTVYGIITASAFGALTTVTVLMDSGALDAGLSAVNISILRNDHPALPLAAYSNYKSKFINGAFRTNQRVYVSGVALAAGVPSTGVGYGHDGWRAGAGGGTYTFTQSKAATTITITAGTLITAAEDASIDSTTMVLSWTGTAQARVGVNGAAPSGAYAASPISITCTAGQQVSAEFNTGTLGKVQLENGSTQTPFEWPDPQSQQARCERYLPCFEAGWMPAQVNTTSTGLIIAGFRNPARAACSGISLGAAVGTYGMTNAAGSTIFFTSLVFSAGAINSCLLTGTAAGTPYVVGSASVASLGGRILFTGAEL